MQDLTLLVAQNLKRIREEKKLSLDKLAELTGVSKSMPESLFYRFAQWPAIGQHSGVETGCQPPARG
jgi:hypothetical protein